ncbi:apotyrosinase chaperone MelC1 [Streptomyces sp. MS06]|uniref:apotyrosinase chaperone MelC1 n=1 Tax=Streptomyces sp. MS06 TaxID=3385974 RepID=UPI0039A20E00
MPNLSRRRALTAAAAVTATAGGAQALAAPPAAAAPAATPPTAPARSAEPSRTGHAHDVPEPFDEVYRGRRIRGRAAAPGGHHHGAGYAVSVDGAPLHLMRNADGSWISVVSHYDPVPSPLAAARAAVDDLQGARLLPLPTD